MCDEGLIVLSLWGGGETRGGDLDPRNDQLRPEEIIEFMESEWAIEKADQWDGVGSTEGPELEAKGWDREASGCEGVVQLGKLERVEDAELTDTASNNEPTELHVEDREKPSIDRWGWRPTKVWWSEGENLGKWGVCVLVEETTVERERQCNNLCY